MSKFSEDTLANWTKPPSDFEESKLNNSERMVKDAINSYWPLKEKSIEVFGQGSYANNTNVRLNSDIDINVRYTGGYFFHLPDKVTEKDVGIDTIPSSQYSFQEFKKDVQNALEDKVGKESVKRKNKSIKVIGNTNRIETDVVPTWTYRRYESNGTYVVGTKFRCDDFSWVTNYPKQHINNGKTKNSNTTRRFKRLVRIFKKLRFHMIDNGSAPNNCITSFLLECLVWNTSNEIILGYDTWTDILKNSLSYIYDKTKSEKTCGEWGEVSELLYLFRSRKWNIKDTNEFIIDAWNYLEF